MAVIQMPPDMRIKSATWGQKRNDLGFNSGVFGTQSVEVGAPQWTASLEIAVQNEYQEATWQALMLQLQGQKNQLELWNVGRPVPHGTLRGNLSTSRDALQGSTTAGIDTGTGSPGDDLHIGDFIGIGQTGSSYQLVMITQYCTSDPQGIMEITFEPPLRHDVLIGEHVYCDKPTTFFRRTSNQIGRASCRERV